LKNERSFFIKIGMPRLSHHQQHERRIHILEAACRCFTRDGFHRTSMQDICREAGVSPGGIYVYFPSKEALIAGLIESDRAEIAAAFSQAAMADDVLRAVGALARHFFVDEPREKSMITLQIWAESARDPAIRALCMSIERDVRDHLIALCQTLKRQGKTVPDLDIEGLVAVLTAMSDGIFKARALDDAFDSEQALAGIMTVFRAGLAGHLDLSRTTPEPELLP
jgi:AcrR family transcriptional regulator